MDVCIVFRAAIACLLITGLRTPLAAEPMKRGSKEASDPKPFTTIPEATGKRLPPFSVLSGDEQKLTHKDLAGRVAAVFYETRETAKKNDAMKKALGRAARAGSARHADWAPVAIVDASSANSFSRPFWKDALRRQSSAEGLTIYGDWDGKAGSSLEVRRGESNLILTDRTGVIRYMGYGRFDEAEIRRIAEVVSRLLQEEATPTRGENSPQAHTPTPLPGSDG